MKRFVIQYHHNRGAMKNQYLLKNHNGYVVNAITKNMKHRNETTISSSLNEKNIMKHFHEKRRKLLWQEQFQEPYRIHS